jgi:hypothetical protein
MAENQVDGGSGEGTATNANGGASGNQSVQQPSFDATKLQSSIDALIEKVGELEARTNGLQSVKDKTNKEVSGLKAKIAEYEQLKERFGADGAIEQIELKQTLEEIKNQLSNSVQAQTSGTSADETVDVAQAFAGFDASDPRVAVAMSKKFASQEAAEFAAFKLSKQLNNSPTPSAAQAASDPGKPAAKQDVEGLTAEYKEKMLAARGNEKMLDSIRATYFKQGVPVYEIDFS